MVLNRVEPFEHFSSIISEDAFSVPDWDKLVRVEGIPDQPVDLFGIESSVHDIEVRLSGSLGLFQEFFGVRDIMDQVLGDLQAGDNLLGGINGDCGFQEPFSGLVSSHRIVMAGIGAGKSG